MYIYWQVLSDTVHSDSPGQQCTEPERTNIIWIYDAYRRP